MNEELYKELLDWISEMPLKDFCEKYAYVYGESVPSQIRSRYSIVSGPHRLGGIPPFKKCPDGSFVTYDRECP